MSKTFNLGKVKTITQSNGMTQGFVLKRDVKTREARYIMTHIFGIELQTAEDYDCEIWAYEEYNKELCQTVNEWLKGNLDDDAIIEYAWDCTDEQLGVFNMIPLIDYLKKREIID